MEPQKIVFKMDGPALKEGIPLYETIVALQEFHFFLDKAYLSLTGGKRISPKDRKKFVIMSQEFKKGSFIAELWIYLFVAGQTLSLFYTEGLTPSDIWEVGKLSLDFLKALFSFRSKGVEPMINVDKSGDFNLYVNHNEGSITVNYHIYQAADRAEPHLKRMSSIIDPGRIDSISAIDFKQEGIILTQEEKELFNPATVIEEKIYTIQCNIYKYDKEANTGKLRVLDEDGPIPAGEYTFKAIKPNPLEVIVAMARPTVAVSVLKEIAIHTSGVKTISTLHLISIDTPSTLF